ncbi:AMP-binding protein, partial [Candidatus Gracilibacteria bacterium]|nr:AMP-binding protein [Candidatus Gracilibacteria bacterium]
MGRILDDGSLQLIGACDRQVWIKGFRVSLPALETKLLENRSVEDCRVLMRETDTMAQLVAYVVSSGQLSLEQLSHLQALPAYMLPSVYVPLSALPLTLTGQVDEEALKRLPVIDSDLVQRWEAQLRSLPEIDRVAVVVQQPTETLPPVHLRDLLLQNPNPHREEEKPKLLTPLPEARQQSGTKKLAVVHGESLEFEPDAPLTLAEALRRAAFQNSNRGIVYIRCDRSEFVQSYENLLEEAQRILAGLRKLGLKPQDKVIFQLKRIQDFIPAFWGCILGGFVPVPLSIPPTYEQVNSAVSKLHNAWQMLGKPIVLAGENSVFTAVFAPLAPTPFHPLYPPC